MAVKTIAAKKLATPSGVLMEPVITIEDGLISEISTRPSQETTHIDCNYPDATITAGFLDIHFHGMAGQDVMNASPDGFRQIARRLALSGVTGFLPTTVTASLDTTLSSLDRMGRYIEETPEEGTARASGIHIEGPFLSHDKRGMHPAQHLVPPSPELLERLWQASHGHIRLMTIAPELPGALETIRHAAVLGIRSSIGHSMANRLQALAAIENGAVSATHTFNAMRAFDHRAPGILEVVLDRDDLYADLICDGLHVAPEAVRLWLRMKGSDRAILITDCLSPAGMPDGLYLAGDTVVHVEGEACRTEAGVLAGSIITLDRAVANLCNIARIDIPSAARLASINPARMLGLPEPLQPGAPADFNIFNPDGVRRGSFVRGCLI